MAPWPAVAFHNRTGLLDEVRRAVLPMHETERGTDGEAFTGFETGLEEHPGELAQDPAVFVIAPKADGLAGGLVRRRCGFEPGPFARFGRALEAAWLRRFRGRLRLHVFEQCLQAVVLLSHKAHRIEGLNQKGEILLREGTATVNGRASVTAYRSPRQRFEFSRGERVAIRC
jgi:hypothetical protein